MKIRQMIKEATQPEQDYWHQTPEKIKLRDVMEMNASALADLIEAYDRFKRLDEIDTTKFDGGSRYLHLSQLTAAKAILHAARTKLSEEFQP